MARPKTPYEVDSIPMRIPRDLGDRLRAYARESGVTITAAVAELIDRALKVRGR
jgi:hypothetical protein